MRWLIRLLKIVLLLAVAVWTFLFALENTQPVRLMLVPFELPERSLGFWIIIAFVCGGGCGLLAGSLMFVGQKRRELRVRRDLRKSRSELEHERSARSDVLAAPAPKSNPASQT